MRKRNKKQLLRRNQIDVLVVIGAVLASFVIFMFFRRIFVRAKPFMETPNSEVKKLPLDVKEKLAKQQNKSVMSDLHIPILMYHYVEYVKDAKDTIRQSLNVDPDVFEQQVKTLSDDGYTFLTAKELGTILDGKMVAPGKSVLLTFDDGHWDMATDVLPILKKYNAKATAYIISDFIGYSDFLSSKQLQEIIKSGLVDVGAHTVNHIILKGKPQSVVESEIVKSKKDLEKKYDIHVVSFAYPNGAFDLQAIDDVKNAGFTTSMSTVPGVDQNQKNRFFLYRLRPGYRTGKILLDYLNSTRFKKT